MEDKNTTKKKKILLCVLSGGLSGICNGLFGGGGGMLIVPMLSYLLKYPAKKAHATAILIILPLSVISGILYAAFGNAELSVLLSSGIGVILGGIIGAFLLSGLSQSKISLLFSFVMLAAGIKMLFF